MVGVRLLGLSMVFLPSAWAACPFRQGVINNLVSAYTPGEQLCLEVTPDGKRGFLAEGARIAVLDLTTNPIEVIERHQVPDCQPLAMRYYQGATGERYLFIAGGTHGIWRLSLCPSLVQPLQPAGCGELAYQDFWLQDPIPPSSFERKRCVDVEILDTGALAGPVLFALFAASNHSDESSVGATELHAYRLLTSGPVPLADYPFPSPLPPFTTPAEVGTCLALDPEDNNSIYVGMGKGGILRFDITQGTPWSLAPNQVWSNSDCPIPAPQPPFTWPPRSPLVQHVRDIAIVKVTGTAPQSVLYAALNYDEVLEITQLGQLGQQACTRIPLYEPGSTPPQPWIQPERIAARWDSSASSVHLALTAQTLAGKHEDARGPFNVNGFWSDICLQSGDFDDDNPGAPQGVPDSPSQVRFYSRKFGTGGWPLTLKSTIDYDSIGELGSNSVSLHQGLTSTTDQVSLCSRGAGTEIYDVDFTSTATPAATKAFIGEGCGAQEGVISLTNPGVMRFFAENAGETTPPASTLYLDPATSSITPVSNTAWSPCTNDYPQPPVGTGCAGEYADPELFASNIFDEAHWVDPDYPYPEYFLMGSRILERAEFTSGACTPTTACASSSPCDPTSGNPAWWMRRHDFNPLPTDEEHRTGWRLVRLLIPPTGVPQSGPSMSPRWWEINLPDELLGSYGPEQAIPGDDRLQTLADERTTGGIPNALYVTRSGTGNGVKALDTSMLMAKAAAACTSTPGTGEWLTYLESDYRTVLTHLELELDPGTNQPGCVPLAPCAGVSISSAKHLINNHADLYMTRDQDGLAMWVLAIASGFPAAAGTFPPQLVGCHWTPYAGLPMLALVDVTQTGDGGFKRPEILRVALGGVQGHAISVRTKQYGWRTRAFVGDIMGMIWVFEVTGSNLLPTPSVPYLGAPPLPVTPLLNPIASLALPRDPFDGYAANCIDLEVVGNYLYCALGRHGVGIVDISDPLNPQLSEVMDTPGLALGLSTRTVQTSAGPKAQLIVGDTRCGLRIYQEP